MFKRVSGLFGVLAMAAVVGCGGSGGGGGEGGTGSGSTAASGHNTTSGTSNTSFECCINDNHFTCPSQGAFDACADFTNPDPSQCKADTKSCGNPTSASGNPTSASGNPTSASGNPATTSGSGGDDVGNQCQNNSDCMHDACLFKPNADVGYCSKTCMSFTDCPTFWDCADIANGSTTYCIQN